MQFKKGDIVRCINVSNNEDIEISIIYIVKEIDNSYSTDFVQLDNYNYLSSRNGFYEWRFKKVSAKDLTEEEKFMYIKWKLGAKV